MLLVDTPGLARKSMTRTRQTKGSTSSESSAFGSVFAPLATKMQESLNKMSAASVYLLENLHVVPFFCRGFGVGKYYLM